MDKPRYRILWIDDKPETVNLEFALSVQGLDIIETLKSEDEVVQYFNTREAALIDGVVIDGLFFKAKDSTEANSLTPFHGALKVMPSDLPKVMYTGQASLENDSSLDSYLEASKIRKFSKTKDEEDVRMAEHLIDLIESRDVSAIRSKYGDICSFCENSQLGIDSWLAIETCLLHIEKGHSLGGLKPYNDLRQVFEGLGQEFHSMGLLPEEFVSPQFQMTNTVFFLKGIHSGYRYDTKYPCLPDLFTEHLIQFFERVTNDGSHKDPSSDGKPNNKALIEGVEKLVGTNNHYILQGVIYMLLTLIRSSKSIILANDNRETNLKTWAVNSQRKILTVIQDGSYYAYQDVNRKTHKMKLKDFNFPKSVNLGDQLEVIINLSNPDWVADVIKLNGQPVSKK